jgi:TfoX/Sxy family transcriptional regulator of competence genes
MDPQERFDEIVDDVLARHGDVERAQMMGMPSLKRNGKLVAGFWKGTMAFKLPDSAEREEALALEGAALFDPGERGRPFKEWVAVPAAHGDRWPELAEKALRG